MLKKLSFLLLLFVVSAHAQDYKWKFNRISISQGLSNTMVLEVMQDDKGFIWFATANGLNRFNGYEIQVFKYNEDDPKSISSDIVSSIFQDSRGTIWVGTGRGLNRYEKKTGKFTRFEGDPELVDGPPVSIQRIVEDLNGMIWLGTPDKNAVRFDPEQETFHWDIDHPENQTIRLVRDMVVDQNNNLWIGYNGLGACKYDIDKDEEHYYHPSYRTEISDSLTYVFGLHEDSEGNIWLGTFIGGLAKYIPSEDNFRFMYNPFFRDNLTATGVQAIGEDMYGNIILGANGGGVFLFDPLKEEFIQNFQFNALNDESISDDFIIEVYTDNTGIIWFGTENGGVFYYDPIGSKFKGYKKEGAASTDLPGVLINAVYPVDDKFVWVGTENNGFAKLNRKTGEYSQLKMENVHRDKGNTFINTLVPDNNGGVWVGSEMGGIGHYDDEGQLLEQYGAISDGGDIKNIIPSHDVLTMCMDSDSILWVGCYRSFFEFDGERSITYCPFEEDTSCLHPVLYIHDYDEQWLIICYSSQGLYFFNKITRQFGSHFGGDDSDPKALPLSWVNSAFHDSKDRLWVGTPKGLSLMDNEDSTFRTYTSKEGLPDNDVLGILEDNDGKLWLSTAFGLSCFDPEAETFRNYFEEDGLQSNVLRARTHVKSASGELFFGGVNGYNSFFPHELEDNPFSPNVVFTDFKIFNKSIEPGPNSALSVLIEETHVIELSYKQDVFSFEFAALSFTVPEKNEYAYKLEGFDDDWNYIGTRRFISFTSIPAGEYTLRVKASNNDGLWNEEGTSIKIIIHPPFWETWWFRSLVILLLAGLIYYIYKRRVRKIEEQNKILETQVADRTKELVEQKEIVEEKNKDMMDSIRYSKRIQDSFLPDIADIKSHFADGFVLFKPKDIVSGDFFWYETVHDKVYLAVADCTGHGVPGAMVSVLGNNGLHRSIKDNGHQEPGVILDDLTDYVVWSLEKKGDIVRDGMDICLCSIDTKTGILKYAGANNPLWINRAGEIIEYKATKQPIGKYADRKPFVTNEIQLEKGDWIFMSSDGFPDQFGGPKGKKYKYATLKKTLLDFDSNDEKDFEKYLNSTFNSWKGDLEQIDDVCILGVRY